VEQWRYSWQNTALNNKTCENESGEKESAAQVGAAALKNQLHLACVIKSDELHFRPSPLTSNGIQYWGNKSWELSFRLERRLSEKMNNNDGDKNISATQKNIAVVNSVINTPLILISIIGNSMVLAAILKTPSIRTPSMIMISSLAVSDLLVGVMAQPLFIANKFKSLTEKDLFLQHVTVMTGFFLCGVSLGTTTVICVDRFMALHYHMRYSTIVTKSRMLCTVTMIWLFTFLCLGLYLWNHPLYHLLAGIYPAICLIICTYLYIKMYGIVRHHDKQIRVQKQAVEISSCANNTHMLRLIKSAVNTFLFYICLVICYFPNVVFMTLYGTVHREWKTEWDLSTTVVFMNSSINPILYCWRLRELRKAMVKIGRGLLNKQTNDWYGGSNTPIAENSWKVTYQCSFRYDNEFDLQSNPIHKETEGATESACIKVARWDFSGSITPEFEHKLRRHSQRFGKITIKWTKTFTNR